MPFSWSVGAWLGGWIRVRGRVSLEVVLTTAEACNHLLRMGLGD